MRKNYGNGYYEGDFHHGLIHGVGTMSFTFSGSRYSGEWREGLIDGAGVIYLANGDRFEAVFDKGKRTEFAIRRMAKDGRFNTSIKNAVHKGSLEYIRPECGGEDITGPKPHVATKNKPPKS